MRRSLVLFTLLAAAPGWRGDGGARYPEAELALTLDPARATWSTAVGSWGNASPVLVGDRVCTTAEPTTVVCLDAASGRLLWNATNDRVDTVAPAEARAIRERLAGKAALVAAHAEAVRRVGELRRDLRRADAPGDTATRLAAASAEVDRLQRALDELEGWETPAVLGLIGYASPTPATDGTHLYVVTGNGVASSFTAGGARRWSVWLGPAVRPMRGYDHGGASSPVLAGGVVVVAHHRLRGLDPVTGKVRWEDPLPWTDYGTPAVTRLSGVDVLLLPDGRALRATDGRVLAEGLGNVYYVGPVAEGDLALWIGGRGHQGDAATNRASAWRLVLAGDRITTTRLWEREVPGAERVYTTPLVADGRVWVFTLDNRLTALDLGTGATVSTTDFQPLLDGVRGGRPPAYLQPTLVGRSVLVGWQSGVVGAVGVDGRGARLVVTLPENARATPVFRGRTSWFRTLGRVWRFDG